MNKSFQRTETVFRIDQVNIGTKNILESDIVHRENVIEMGRIGNILRYAGNEDDVNGSQRKRVE